MRLWKEDKRLTSHFPKRGQSDNQKLSSEKLKTGRYGIIESQGDRITDLSVIDMIIIPGVAFDKKRNRLGRGKGILRQVTITS